MDTFDTQMFDSGDGDIPMYTGNGPSEPWFSVEATMADEGTNAGFQPYHTDQSVEIEMADHDDEITEYEMADEREYGRDNDAEVVDIDLVDVSRQASPPPGVSTLSVPHFRSEVDPTYERGLSLASFGPFADSAQEVRLGEVVEHPMLPQTVEYGSAATAPMSDAQPSDEPASSIAQDLEQVPDSVVTQTALMNGAGVHLPGEESAAADVVEQRETQTTANTADAGDASHHVVVQEQSDVAENKDIGDGSSTPQQADRLPSPLPSASLPTEQADDHTVDPYEVEEPPVERPANALGVHATTTAENILGADPHEISEGVYIDPPPAVLLTVSSASNPLECCLFNQPVRSPGSQSPSTSSVAERALLLLLHHRPTLYYEALSVVFDALRQEEHIKNVYDLERDELVLDAYDLQLIVSEDNVHVHEVTLHDLNVLHDGADLTGPLRLELRVMPRFISRYNALRDQIARLDLAVEEEQAYESELASEHRGEEGTVFTHEAQSHNNADGTEHRQEQEVQETAQEEDTGEQEATSHEYQNTGENEAVDTQVPKSPREEPQGDTQGVQEPEQDEYEGAQEEAREEDAPYESEEVQEYVDENALNAGGDVLDADEIHRTTSSSSARICRRTSGGEEEGDPEESQAFKDETATDLDDANPVPSEGIDLLETPAFLSSDFTTLPADQYDAEQRDEDGYTDAGETLRTDESGPTQDNDPENPAAVTIDDDFEEYDDEPTVSLLKDHDVASRADAVDEEWMFESPEDISAALPGAEHDLSRTVSSSSRSSKRGHDEVDVDEDEDEGSNPQSSPDVKKARIQ
ncbi:hypothetical protein EVJ58_g8427 [Rhodofomes roseus]|uniref:Uncharacterized protein n=2 Tax=Rhodofomes roseus TaxID=34475 RepID=A0A4Y9Y0A1_9APHY|nr:hypothetical protein EVJ58_g8427 [Rhodofomes roseus]